VLDKSGGAFCGVRGEVLEAEGLGDRGLGLEAEGAGARG
jgi:hypothetical protein